jgi:MFS family permease
VTAGVIGVLCAFVVKDAAPATRESEARGETPTQATAVDAGQWTAREAVLTRQFLIIAVTMLVIQTVVTTVHGMIVAHLARLGSSTAFGALVMSILGLTDSIAKGVAGTVSARIGPRRLLIGGITMLCAAVALLTFASSHVVACAFGVVLGIGWGASWLSAHLLLLEYFGRNVAAEMVSTATLITTVAIVGPVAAGRIADVTGTFVPFFYVLAAIMVVTALVCTTLRPPRLTRGSRPQLGVVEARAEG